MKMCEPFGSSSAPVIFIEVGERAADILRVQVSTVDSREEGPPDPWVENNPLEKEGAGRTKEEAERRSSDR